MPYSTVAILDLHHFSEPRGSFEAAVVVLMTLRIAGKVSDWTREDGGVTQMRPRL